MRKFSSYGPVNKNRHYYVPRTELVEKTLARLTGETPDEGGHYVTVWAPRQCGKTGLMREVVGRIRETGSFEVGLISMQSAKTETTDRGVLELFVEKLAEWFAMDFRPVAAWKDLRHLFSDRYFEKPLILAIDEFDALDETFINKFANEFRDIYITRQMASGAPGLESAVSLHRLALIGVRSVLGIENVTGSPFNVQRSLHIPNLTFEEVQSMFQWYENESGQHVDPVVVERIYKETRGQPGLVSWFGELVTEGYEGYAPDRSRPVSPDDFEMVFADAVSALPNNNVLNMISKARREPYKGTVLELFKTREILPFRFDDPLQNFLYMNGVIDREKISRTENAVRFSSPFVQKRLFNYFSREIFRTMDHLYDPMTDIEAVVKGDSIDIPALMRLYRQYLVQNRDWLFKNAPRRKTDLRIYEAVFHFNLYMYLDAFFRDKGGYVFPEFPTGNGKIDLLIQYGKVLYALELKSFKDRYAYHEALSRAAKYAVQLGLDRIYLIFFIETIDKENRQRLAAVYHDDASGVSVAPIFVETDPVADPEQPV